MQYYHQRKNTSDAVCVVRILVSTIVILLSIAAIYVVVIKISEIKILEKINFKEEEHKSLNIVTDSESGTTMFITDDKGIKFRKEDKSFACDEWVEKNGELFYFDTAGYGLNGDLKQEGQVYTFENGKLKNIKRDTSYVNRAKDELYGSIETTQYLVWLSDEDKDKSYFAIKYRQYSDDTEDFLGTSADKQYASPNMLKINMSNIYYLAVGKNTTYAGRLYRMRPGAIHKETVGVGVTGFIVLSDDIVYYCDGSKVIKAKSWKGIELKLPDDEELTEDGEIVKISTTSDLILVKPVATPSELQRGEQEESETKIRETKKGENEKGEVVPILDSDISVPESKKKDVVIEVGKGPVAVEVEAPR